MRTFGVVVLGAVASFLVAMVVVVVAAWLGLVAQPGPHQEFEFLLVTAAMVVVAVGTALIFLTVLALGGRQAALRWTAIVLAALLVVALAAPLVFGLAIGSAGDLTGQDALGQLTIFLAAIAVPGVLAILVQWQIVRRTVVRGQPLQASTRGQDG